MRSAVDSARESDDRDFCMMGLPMQGELTRAIAKGGHAVLGVPYSDGATPTDRLATTDAVDWTALASLTR
jgi:hypothetical protein